MAKKRSLQCKLKKVYFCGIEIHNIYKGLWNNNPSFKNMEMANLYPMETIFMKNNSLRKLFIL